MDWNLILTVVLVAAALLAGGDYLFHRTYIRKKRAEALARARAIEEDSERRAEMRLRELELEAREKSDAAEAAFEQESRRKRTEMTAQKRQLEEQERLQERKASLLAQKQGEMEAREQALVERDEALAARQRELQTLVEEQRGRLERMAGMSTQQAKRELMREMESLARAEAATSLKRIEEETRERAEAQARQIVLGALQRIPSGQMVDLACSVVTLPNDEMKGRIIGREGRNIRALEMATGIDLIVDDTPSAIILSGFDPMRREIAKVSIERLVEDGRIHPGRIEEVVSKVREDMDALVLQTGETAAFEVGIVSLSEKLASLVGKMKFHVVSGYNLLQHCREVAELAAAIASEFEIATETVRRGGLLHGIGYVEQSSADTPPLLLSAELAARSGESHAVVEALRSLQPGLEPHSLDAFLLRTARRISLSRPGMRRENLDIWMGRMREMEQVAMSFPGVARAYAMRSGKELRVIVETEKISDSDVIWLSKDIASRIEKEMTYPGQIRINVIRETRAVDYAK